MYTVSVYFENSIMTSKDFKILAEASAYFEKKKNGENGFTGCRVFLRRGGDILRSGIIGKQNDQC